MNSLNPHIIFKHDVHWRNPYSSWKYAHLEVAIINCFHELSENKNASRYFKIYFNALNKKEFVIKACIVKDNIADLCRQINAIIY